jgi:hypothetical protein
MVQSASAAEVTQLLAGLGLAHYTDAFLDEEFDTLERLAEVTRPTIRGAVTARSA